MCYQFAEKEIVEQEADGCKERDDTVPYSAGRDTAAVTMAGRFCRSSFERRWIHSADDECQDYAEVLLQHVEKLFALS